MQYVVGIDIGGTCTDCVVVDETGRVTLAKAFSTPPDFSSGIVDSLGVAADALGVTVEGLLKNTRLFLHSTTVAENAVVDGTLAKAGVITTQGFEDTLLAMRGGYGRWSGLTEEEKRNPIETEKPEPIVPRSLVVGVKERTDVQGEVLLPAQEEQIIAAARQLVDSGVEAIGVSLLWSFVNPSTEQQVKAVIERLWPDRFVTVSHEIAPIIGEYERTSTVALNARLGPVVQRYLNNLRSKLDEHGFTGILLVMQAYGGLLPVEKAALSPVGMIESGPVSGLVGCKHLGERLGFKNVIVADMGGTTFKSGVVRDGLIEYQRESMVYRYHFALPKMDVVSLGLAGGSVISVDPETGEPHIGPRSAGSYPGPICYDHGGDEPTVTDVDAILGYMNPKYFLGGRAGLNVEKARRIFEEKVAKPLGMPVLQAAAAMYRLANSLIYDLLHKTTVQRGLDPRHFALFSTGGTNGMHVAAYSDELDVSQIVIPYSASVHGAFGLPTSDIVHEDQTTKPMRWPADLDELNRIFSRLDRRMVAQLHEEGFTDAEIRMQRSIDMRYRRQVHILTVPLADEGGEITASALEATLARFHRLYEEKYGKESAFREAGVELVSFRVRGSGLVQTPEIQATALGDTNSDHAIIEVRQAWVHKAQELQEVRGYDFERLVPGNVVQGPAVIWTPITTVVLNPDQAAQVDAYKNLIISRT